MIILEGLQGKVVAEMCPAHQISTTEGVAQALKLSVRFILQAIKSGQLEARQTGKQYLITREAVQKFWESLPLAAKKQ